MIRRTVAAAVVLILACLGSHSEAARDARVEIVDNDSEVMRTVRGYAPRRLWLGVTAEYGGREKDFEVKRVRRRFSQSYTLSIDEMPRAISEGVTWKIGYHLAGRVARDVD